MPVPFVLGNATSTAAEEVDAAERIDALMPYEERHAPPGEEPLPAETDDFYDSAKYENMESVWRRVFCLGDRLLDETLSLRGLVRRMRELTDELEGLSSQGYVLDLDAMDGDIIALVNPSLEREQWRLRRERRRAAMAQEQGAAEEAAADRRTAGDAMDTDEGGVRMPILPAEAPALAAPKSPRPQVPFAPPPAFELC